MFKITIQPESALAKELESLLPRQRNSRLIELATIGLAFSRQSVQLNDQFQNPVPINTKKTVDDFVTCEKMTTITTDAKLVTAKQNSPESVSNLVGNTDFGEDLLIM